MVAHVCIVESVSLSVVFIVNIIQKCNAQWATNSCEISNNFGKQGSWKLNLSIKSLAKYLYFNLLGLQNWNKHYLMKVWCTGIC